MDGVELLSSGSSDDHVMTPLTYSVCNICGCLVKLGSSAKSSISILFKYFVVYIQLFYDACLVSCAVALRRNDQHIYWVIVRVSNLQILFYVFV